MINFFRKIRKKLADDNKPLKYARYAIGEILLVVIGILIALSINNWNEKRKISNEIENVFTLLEQELKANINESNNFLKYGYQKDSVRTLFNENKVTREMILASPSFSLIFRDFGTRTIKFLDDRLIEIIALEKQIPSKYTDLIPELKLLKRRIDEHRFWESKALDLARRKTEEYVNKFTWYHIFDSLAIKKHIQHSLTDTIYRNNVNYYNRLQLDENVWYASLLRTSSVAALWQIKQIKSLDKTLTIKQFLNDLNLEPLTEYACTDKPYEVNEIYFRRNIIIYNDTNDTITYYKIDELGKRLNPVKVSPYKFLLTKEDMMNNRFIELTIDNQCSKVFKQNKEDYLLFE